MRRVRQMGLLSNPAPTQRRAMWECVLLLSAALSQDVGELDEPKIAAGAWRPAGVRRGVRLSFRFNVGAVGFEHAQIEFFERFKIGY